MEQQYAGRLVNQLTLAHQPRLVCTAMALPLSHGRTIVSRPSGNIQTLATMARDESISCTNRLYAPLLVRTVVALPLEDRRAIRS